MAVGEIKVLCKGNIYIWTMLTFIDWSVILLSFLLAASIDHIVTYWIASLIIGNRIHALAILGHDGSHYSIVRQPRWLNDLMTCVLVFWPLGISLEGYRRFHLAHHRATGTEHDPELIHKNKWAAPEYDTPLSRRRMIYYLLRDLTGYGVIDVVRVAILFSPKNPVHMIGPVLTQTLFCIACILTQNIWVLVLWYFSVASSFWAHMRIRIWLEHVGTEGTHRYTVKPWQEYIFLPHFVAYHHEHHQNPAIPCWNLPKARALENPQDLVSAEDVLAHLLTAKK